MDHFGIGLAMHGMARMYSQSARRTGRTSSLVESVKDGDRIVFTNSKEAERVRRLCLQRGVKVEVMIAEPHQQERVFERGTPQGRTLFDHSWVEQYYLNAIERAQREIDHLERLASGHGEAYCETARRDKELATWRY